MIEGYSGADVERAKERLKHECPLAVLSETDFGFSLSVADLSKHRAFVVFQAHRPDIKQSQIIGDLDGIIAALNAN